MMTSRRQNLFIGSAVALLFGVLCWISFDFMHSVQQSLWDNSVKNIMESTARGANVLQRGYVKDLEMLRMLASELEQGKSSDSGRIRSKLKTFLSDTGNLSALIFEDGPAMWTAGLPLRSRLRKWRPSKDCTRAVACCSHTATEDRAEDIHHLYGGGFPRRAQGVLVQGL